jgi:hypothetical protein
MTLYDIDFRECEQFLLKLCSRLKLFNVNIRNTDENYLDANRWERLISQHMPSLEIFIFRYSDTIDDDFQMSDYHSLTSCFTSSFWIDQKWIFKLLIEEDELIYSIRPYEYVIFCKREELFIFTLFLEKLGLIFKNIYL